MIDEYYFMLGIIHGLHIMNNKMRLNYFLNEKEIGKNILKNRSYDCGLFLGMYNYQSVKRI